MTVRMSFAQRRLLDTVLRYGDRGMPRMQGFQTATEAFLIREGYATWSNGESGTATLKITDKGKSFYPSHHHESD